MEKKFGIDISRHQGNFPIQDAVDNFGVEFIMIKAGGSDDGRYTDSQFENNYVKCKNANVPVGCYWYTRAKSVHSSKADAEYLLSLLNGKKFEYPIVLDVEDGQIIRLDKRLLTDIIIAFCDTIESAGYFVSIYTRANILFPYTYFEELEKYDKWIAQYADECTYDGQYGMWQFGGEVNTIRSNTICDVVVDQDYAYRDYADIIVNAGLNGFGYIKSVETVPVQNNPSGTTLDLAYNVMTNVYSNGEERRINLGVRYSEVQDFINHISEADVNTLVEETKAGMYGNGQTRKTVLGSRWDEVQDVIDRPREVEYCIKDGDTLSAIASKFNTDISDIINRNNIENPNLIYTGSTLIIPVKEP